MDGGRHGGLARSRALWRGILTVITIVVAAVAIAGTAQANDRSTDVVCVDPSTGAWQVKMTFSSIDVHDGHPVVLRFGSDSATLGRARP